jgi:hypothetical protein
MEKLYTRQKNAIKNWHKIATRVHIIRSIGFNIIDVDYSAEFQADRTIKKAWYESGSYIIMPDTIWYLIWDVVKSCMYMISLYTLAYSAAFKFEGENSFEVFELVVDLVQIVDIIHTFFTAKKVRSLTQTTLKLRKKEMDAIETK